MKFRLLGPVEAIADGEPLELGRRRERGILTLLLLEPGQPASVERLIELLFDEHRPRDPRKAVQIDVSRLRRALSVADLGDVRLVSDHNGYAIHTDPMSVDVHRFTALVGQARETVDPTERHRTLDEALVLWRGPALTDLSHGTAAEPLRARFEELRLGALELRVETALELGRHAELVPELADLTAQHPTRERLVAARMLALYRCGRKRDALDVYEKVAGQLVEELGLDPGPALRDLHTAILRDDATLAAAPSPVAPEPPSVRPAQLPADLPAFTGREDELASLLARCRIPHETVVIVAIDGMAGIGKTTLAVRASHQLVPHYPDGQLFVDLKGFTDGVEPLEPADALDRLLRSLGVAAAQIPSGTDERAALYRSVLADRRVLVLLDNAASEAQVEPLLPAAPGCLAIVTSRRRLVGLDHLSPLSLDVLPADDAAALFVRAAGQGRLADEPVELVEEVARICDRLPLAVRIAGARLRTRTAWTLAYLVERLRDERRRLTELEVGPRSVAGAFRLSYEQLTEPQRRMFRLLGLHPGDDVDLHAAAALADCAPETAEQLLDELHDVHLLQQHRPGRYRFHDLMRSYAGQAGAADETETDRRAAVSRLLDHYAGTAAVAMNLRYPREASRRPDVPDPAAPPVDLVDLAASTAWLDAELDNVLGLATHSWSAERSPETLRLAQLAWRHVHTRGRVADAERLHTHALAVARRLHDQTGEVRALVGLGRIGYVQQRYDRSVDLHREAAQLARTIGDRVSELDALIGLARVHHSRGRLEPADRYYRQALDLAEQIHDRDGELDALGGLGALLTLQGRYEEAADCFERGLALDRAADDQVGELSKLNGLAAVRYGQGNYAAAAEHNDRALVLARDVGHRAAEGQALTMRGDLHRIHGRYESAAECHRQVIAIAQRTGDRNGHVEGLLGLGTVLQTAGSIDDALVQHEQARTLAAELGQRYDEARALDGIAHALHDLGRLEEARHGWQDALAIVAELDLPDADRIRASLAALDQGTPAQPPGS